MEHKCPNEGKEEPDQPCIVCQGLVIPIELELEAKDIVKVDIWTHHKLDQIGRRLNVDIVFPRTTLVLQCLLSWLCVAI